MSTQIHISLNSIYTNLFYSHAIEKHICMLLLENHNYMRKDSAENMVAAICILIQNLYIHYHVTCIATTWYHWTYSLKKQTQVYCETFCKSIIKHNICIEYMTVYTIAHVIPPLPAASIIILYTRYIAYILRVSFLLLGCSPSEPLSLQCAESR